MDNKKILIGCGAAALIFLVIILIVIFRGGGNNGGGGANNGKVVIWSPIDQADVYDPLIEKFLVNNKGVEVKVVKKDSSTYEDDVINAIANGGGPDIWFVRNDWIPKHIDKISPMKSDETIVKAYKKEFVKVVSEENIINNKIYGLPLSADPLVLYSNARVISIKIQDYIKSHPHEDSAALSNILNSGPRTWDELVQLSKIINEKNGDVINYPAVALGTTSNINNSQDILYLMMLQNKTSFYDNERKNATFHLPGTSLTGATIYPGTLALQRYTNFAIPGKEEYSWNANMPNSLQSFIDGKVAMIIDYASVDEYIKQVNPTLSYARFAVPQVKGSDNKASYARYWSMTVNRNSKKKDLAWEFINFLDNNSEVNNLYLQNTGGFSTHQPYNMKGLTFNTVTPQGQLEYAKALYKPDAARFDTILRGMIDSVVLQNVSPQVAIEAAAAKVNRLLEEVKKGN